MPRLDAAEKKAIRDCLTRPASPQETLDKIHKINGQMGSVDFMTQTDLQFIRDAWVSAMLAKSLGAETVQLVPEVKEWPDAVITVSGIQEELECVEADLPGRRRGQEYKEARTIIEADGYSVERFDDEGVQAVNECRQIPAALWRAAKQKADKHYSRPVSLLINLNIDSITWGTPYRQERMANNFARWTKPAARKFNRVWILWEGRRYGPYHEVTSA